jgi:hypothetical protein
LTIQHYFNRCRELLNRFSEVSVSGLAVDSFGEFADAPADLVLADVPEAEYESGRTRVRIGVSVHGHEPVVPESVDPDSHGRGGLHDGALGCPVGEEQKGVTAGR